MTIKNQCEPYCGTDQEWLVTFGSLEAHLGNAMEVRKCDTFCGSLSDIIVHSPKGNED